MGRRSEIAATANKRDGKVSSIRIGGATAYVSTGELEVPSGYLTNGPL